MTYTNLLLPIHTVGTREKFDSIAKELARPRSFIQKALGSYNEDFADLPIAPDCLHEKREPIVYRAEWK
jgi:hypothetical protein